MKKAEFWQPKAEDTNTTESFSAEEGSCVNLNISGSRRIWDGPSYGGNVHHGKDEYLQKTKEQEQYSNILEDLDIVHSGAKMKMTIQTIPKGRTCGDMGCFRALN